MPFIGIVIGVFAYLSVSAVMNGFDRDIMERIIGMKSEMIVRNHDKTPMKDYHDFMKALLKHPKIDVVAPGNRAELMIMKGENSAGVVLYGAELKHQEQISPVFSQYPKNFSIESDEIRRGMFSGYRSDGSYPEDSIILGYDLAMQLRAMPGDVVKVLSPIGTIPTAFGLMPKSKDLKVAGLFISGMPEYDNIFAYTSLGNCSYFLENVQQDEIQFLEVKTYNPREIDTLANELTTLYPNYDFQPWSSFDRNLYSAMKLEKVVMMAILSLMIIITSFNLTGNFAKMIVRQRKEIGILKSLGCTKKDIFSIYLRQGMTIGISGTALGIALATLFMYVQNRWHLIKIPTGNLPMNALPIEPRAIDFIVISAICLIISFIATLVPAIKAGKVQTIDIIRQ